MIRAAIGAANVAWRRTTVIVPRHRRDRWNAGGTVPPPMGILPVDTSDGSDAGRSSVFSSDSLKFRDPRSR